MRLRKSPREVPPAIRSGLALWFSKDFAAETCSQSEFIADFETQWIASTPFFSVNSAGAPLNLSSHCLSPASFLPRVPLARALS